MRTFLTALALACVTVPVPVLAWDLQKYSDHVTTTERAGNYILSVSCWRGRDQFEFGLADLSLRGGEFHGVTAIMMWIKAPDGRTDKWSIEVGQEGPSLTGPIHVSSQTLDFFGNAESVEVEDIFGRRTLFRSGMKGTGAARIAFRERCGI